jgi:hypothetical protein
VSGTELGHDDLMTSPARVDAAKRRATTHTHFTDNIVRVGLNYQFP